MGNMDWRVDLFLGRIEGSIFKFWTKPKQKDTTASIVLQGILKQRSGRLMGPTRVEF